MKRGSWFVALIVAATFSGDVLALAPRAHAVPAPEVEISDITVRRHYSFATAADAINYAHGICDKVSNGASYAQVMADVKTTCGPTTSTRLITWSRTR